MPKTLIEQKPTFSKKVEGENKLAIAEFFCDTIQGEGVHTGVPATFLRLQGCTLQCTWCDTLDVWPIGNEYSFDEIFTLIEENDLVEKFKEGQHLVITGGSPLKQQDRLTDFIRAYFQRYNYIPYIEVENEVILRPTEEFSALVSCWNNSPKLANSGMKEKVRFKSEIIKDTAALENSWFKFVVDCEEDWQEINEFYLQSGLINKSQVILMPCGQTQKELNKTREIAADMAVKYGVRYSDRAHVTIWNKKTGV